jgi:hypothetical protein
LEEDVCVGVLFDGEAPYWDLCFFAGLEGAGDERTSSGTDNGDNDRLAIVDSCGVEVFESFGSGALVPFVLDRIFLEDFVCD